MSQPTEQLQQGLSQERNTQQVAAWPVITFLLWKFTGIVWGMQFWIFNMTQWELILWVGRHNFLQNSPDYFSSQPAKRTGNQIGEGNDCIQTFRAVFDDEKQERNSRFTRWSKLITEFVSTCWVSNCRPEMQEWQWTCPDWLFSGKKLVDELRNGLVRPKHIGDVLSWW